MPRAERAAPRYEIAWLETTEQLVEAAGVATRALRDSPMSLAVSADPAVRFEVLYKAFAGMLPAGPPAAGIVLGGCVIGVAGYALPGHCVASLLPPESRLHEPPGPGATDIERFWYSGSVMAEHDLPADHVHVGPVSIEPGFQGGGMGTAVMGLLCERLDAQHQVAWLETDKPENVRFYLSLGFEVLDESPMLTAHAWFMRRDPR